MTPFTLKERKHKQSGWAGANCIFVLSLTALKTNLQQCQAVKVNEGQTIHGSHLFLNVAYVFPFSSQTAFCVQAVMVNEGHTVTLLISILLACTA